MQCQSTIIQQVRDLRSLSFSLVHFVSPPIVRSPNTSVSESKSLGPLFLRRRFRIQLSSRRNACFLSPIRQHLMIKENSLAWRATDPYPKVAAPFEYLPTYAFFARSQTLRFTRRSCPRAMGLGGQEMCT